MPFVPADPDPAQSPLTGLARRHWVAAAKFLLAGPLRQVRGLEDPPTVPGDAPGVINLETLARTFMLAAPVMAEEPEAVVGGVRLREYYTHQLVAALDSESPRFVGHFADVARQRNRAVLGHTVEGAAITVGLWMAGDEIWPRLAAGQRERIAGWMHEVAHSRTNTHNWRWFNVLMASFLGRQGYAIDRDLMCDHLQNLMAYYAGDGWYRDGTHFDFYSAWAFQFYGPIWCRLWGYEHMPEVAAIVERRHVELQRSYPLMFGREGRGPMWGRSIIYRCAMGCPLPAAFLLNRQEVDAGWARRIASGNLLQFLGREDTFDEGVPTLGFYGRFPPVVQGYSRRGSVYWLAKVFVALALPRDSTFWTAVENEGAWAGLGAESRTVALRGPGLTITAHGRTGASELRPGKVPGDKSDVLYTRLAYNTALPAEADNPHGATAGSYAIRPLAGAFGANTGMRYAGMREGVLYRQTDLPGWWARVDLADVVVPGGVVRVDRLHVPYACELRLGHFGVPAVGGQQARVSEVRVGESVATCVYGGDGRGVALLPLAGWDGVAVERHQGLNAEADESTVVAAVRRRERDHSGVAVLGTLMLHRTDGKEWTAEELSVVRQMTVRPWTESGSPCGVAMELADSRRIVVDFGTIAGDVCT